MFIVLRRCQQSSSRRIGSGCGYWRCLLIVGLAFSVRRSRRQDESNIFGQLSGTRSELHLSQFLVGRSPALWEPKSDILLEGRLYFNHFLNLNPPTHTNNNNHFNLNIPLTITTFIHLSHSNKSLLSLLDHVLYLHFWH